MFDHFTFAPSQPGRGSTPSNSDNKGTKPYPRLTGEYQFGESIGWDPNGIPFKFSSAYPKLPADAGAGCPRIINIESFVKASNFDTLCAPDMVVTVLYNYNEKILDAFLNTKGNDVKFCRHEPPVLYHNKHGRLHEGNPRANDFFVERKGSLLRCGYVDDEVYEYRIKDSGEWTPLSCEIRGLQPYTKLEQIQKRGVKFAADGLELEWWKEVDGVTIEVVGVDSEG